MKIRRELGALADWPGPASAEAISLARAIEAVMDTLFSAGTHTGEFTWFLTVNGDQVRLRLSHPHGQHWRAYSDELKSVLSLWMYFVHEKEHGKPKESLYMAKTTDDAWLRAKGTPAKPSLQIIGSRTPALHQDLWWWMPDRAARVVSGDDNRDVEEHRVVGFSDTESHWKDTLAVRSFSPLKTLYAQHMFSVFMWAVANKMDKPIEDQAVVQLAQDEDTKSDTPWRSSRLHGVVLSKLAQDIQATQPGGLDDIYSAIVPPLSATSKLPPADEIIKWTRAHVGPHERLGQWKTASEVYVWLFETTTNMLGQEQLHTKATALLMEFSMTLADAIELRWDQKFDEGAVPELEQLVSGLDTRIRTSGILPDLMALYIAQGRPYSLHSVQWIPEVDIWDEDSILWLTKLHKLACCNIGAAEGMKDGAGLDKKDALDWTPLHYAAARQSHDYLQRFLTYQVDVNAPDIRRRTPLHYACWHGDTPCAKSLLMKGADISIRDIDGLAPIHHTAIRGSTAVVALLRDAGADVDGVDSLGNIALLWALSSGVSTWSMSS